jgi:uncharacterized membrane-anchored protein YhcB (DUF1043 family)
MWTAFIVGLVIGLFVGANFGFLVLALCKASKMADERYDQENMS